MHSDQCNICGSYEELLPCAHCTTVLCQNCQRNHSPLCEDIQKRKKRGEGPTVGNTPTPPHRAGHQPPPTTGPDRRTSMPAVLGAPYKLEISLPEALVASGIGGGLEAYVSKLTAPAEPIDQAIAAVKDLLGEE